MDFKFLLFNCMCIIFCIQCKIPMTYAIIGLNVRSAEPREYLYVASFMHVDFQNRVFLDNYICTAALITRTHVLSAAHCIENRLKNETVVLTGSTRLNRCRTYGILWWINYNTWGAYSRIRVRFEINDISITKLDRATDDDIIPGALSPLRNQDYDEENAVLVGWGRTNNGEIPNNMMKATLRFLTLDECIARIQLIERRIVRIHSRHLCTAAYPYILLHQGDSGGPVIYRNMIVGINIATTPLPDVIVHPGKVNLHLGIDYYRNFITAVTTDNFIWP